MIEDLYAAIDANPDDVDSYRVLADALESAGDPRGALIAMQLARATAAIPVKARQLDEQIARYFVDHADALLGPLRRWADDAARSRHWTWRNGFIHALAPDQPIRDEPAKVVELMRAVFAHPAGRFVGELALMLHKDHQRIVDVVAAEAPATLRGLQIAIYNGRVDLTALWRRPLTKVSLSQMGLYDLGIEEMPHVRVAALTDVAIAAALARWPVLEELTLNVGRITSQNENVMAMLESPHLPRLERLKIFGCGFANALVEHLSSTVIGQQLVELDLDYGSLDDAGARAWAARPPARRLKVLRVRENELSKAGREALAAVAERVIARQKDEQ